RIDARASEVSAVSRRTVIPDAIAPALEQQKPESRASARPVPERPPVASVPRGAGEVRFVCAGFVVLVACGSAQPLAGSPATAPTPPDAGSVPQAIDGGQPSAQDGGTDAGPVGATDAGTPDAGP